METETYMLVVRPDPSGGPSANASVMVRSAIVAWQALMQRVPTPYVSFIFEDEAYSLFESIVKALFPKHEACIVDGAVFHMVGPMPHETARAIREQMGKGFDAGRIWPCPSEHPRMGQL